MQPGEFSFDNLDESFAIVWPDLPIGPRRDLRGGTAAPHTLPNKLGNERANLLSVTKPERIWLAEGLANGGVTRGRTLVSPDEDVSEKVDFVKLIDAEHSFSIERPGYIRERERR
jgi:hypothetical protein